MAFGAFLLRYCYLNDDEFSTWKNESVTFPRTISSPRFEKLLSHLSPLLLPETAAIHNMSLSVGDTIPEGTFKYVPYTPELEDGVSAM